MRQGKAISPLLILCISLLAAGCVTDGKGFPSGRGYTKLCQKYVGKDSQELIQSWGYPGRTRDAEGNKKVLIYTQMKDPYAINPMSHSGFIEYPPRIDTRKSQPGEVVGNVLGQSISSMDYCITYFEVDENNRITRVLWRGDCKALENPPEVQAPSPSLEQY